MWHEFYNVKLFSTWPKAAKIFKNCIKWLLSCVNQAFTVHLIVDNSPSLGHKNPCLRPWVTILDLKPGSLKVSCLSCASVRLFPIIPLIKFWLLHLLYYGYNNSGSFPTCIIISFDKTRNFDTVVNCSADPTPIFTKLTSYPWVCMAFNRHFTSSSLHDTVASRFINLVGYVSLLTNAISIFYWWFGLCRLWLDHIHGTLTSHYAINTASKCSWYDLGMLGFMA